MGGKKEKDGTIPGARRKETRLKDHNAHDKENGSSRKGKTCGQTRQHGRGGLKKVFRFKKETRKEVRRIFISLLGAQGGNSHSLEVQRREPTFPKLENNWGKIKEERSFSEKRNRGGILQQGLLWRCDTKPPHMGREAQII